MSTVNEEAGITVFNGTGQKIEVLFQEEVQLDINVPLFYIKSGEEEIQAYVNNHAKPELDEYTGEKKREIADKSAEDIETAKRQIDGYVTGMANPAVQKYADETIKPQLEVIVSEAEKSAEAAAVSAGTAAESELVASTKADDAHAAAEEAGVFSTEAQESAETARQWAVGTLEEQPAGSSEYWAGEAKTAAENADNGYELFQASWFDHKPESASWLRADTFSWQDGGVYFAAYNELSAQFAAETSAEETDTVGDIAISYKRTPKGYKICAPDQADTIAALYENTGVAWYYILDIENTRFKLPRTKWGFVGCRNNVGNYVPESLPNIAGETAPGMHSGNAGINQEAAASALRTVRVNTWGVNNSVNNAEFQQTHVNLNASRSSSAYQDGAPVQQRSVEMYLYFFVGNTVKADTVIDTGQITEALNGKLDIDLSNLPVSGKSKIAALGMPTKRGSDMTLNASGNSYTAPANGYFNVVLNCGGKWANISTSTGLYTAYGNNTYANTNFPVKKGDKITITYESGVTANRFRFIYAEGENE